MTWPDKAFLAVYFLVVIIIQCWWQARLFKANKPISHKLHALYYLLACFPVMFMYLPMWWKVVVIGLVERLALFDMVLNLARSKPLLYNGKGTTGSLQDRLENHLSMWAVKVLKVFYVAVFVTVLILV